MQKHSTFQLTWLFCTTHGKKCNTTRLSMKNTMGPNKKTTHVAKKHIGVKVKLIVFHAIAQDVHNKNTAGVELPNEPHPYLHCISNRSM